MRFLSQACCVVSAVTAVLVVLPMVSAGSQASDRGAEIFATHGCAHCHGERGVGGGRGPDLQLVRQRLHATDIAQQIHDGGKGMPAYGDQLSDGEVDDLVAFLRVKRKFIAVPKVPVVPAPVVEKPDPS